MALGENNVYCRVHPDFRAVVIAEKVDAYTETPPPLLNRFEKQVLEREHVMSEQEQALKIQLHDFCKMFVGEKADESSIRDAFCGYHPEYLASLAMATDFDCAGDKPAIANAISRLMMCATPEKVAGIDSERMGRLIANYHVHVQDLYFKHQVHSTLQDFLKSKKEASSEEQALRVSCRYQFF